MTDVFISYSRKDKDFVLALHQALVKRDRDTWVDWEDIPLTAKWLEELYTGIEHADAFAFVISPESVASKVCKEELDHAVHNNKRLVPIWHRNVDNGSVPPNLSSHQYICFRESDDFDESFESLIEALDTDLEWVRAHTRLLTRAKEWESEGRDGSLLLRGKDLETAEAWQAREAEKEPKLTPLQKEYINASRRAATRFKRVVLAATTFVLAVVILGLLALWQRREAAYQSEIAFASQLASKAETMRDRGGESLQNSALLAVEAKRRLPSSIEADQTLRRGLALLPRSVALLPHEDFVTRAAFSPDGRYLATASDDGTAGVWDAESGAEVARLEHDDVVTRVDFSPNGEYLATASNDGTARVWDVESGSEVAPRMDHDNAVNGIDFSPDGEYLATTSNLDDTAHIWDATSGEEVESMKHEEPAHSVVFSPDGEYLATASDDSAVRVWDASDGSEVRRIEQEGSINDLAFSPDGERLATASFGRAAYVWDAESGEEVARLKHDDVVNRVYFSPDGKYLATAGYDATAHVWDAASGDEVARMEHDDAVKGVAFSPDGEYLATASVDKISRVQPWRPEGLADEACARLTRNLTKEEWQQSLNDTLYYRKTCPNLPEPQE